MSFSNRLLRVKSCTDTEGNTAVQHSIRAVRLTIVTNQYNFYSWLYLDLDLKAKATAKEENKWGKLTMCFCSENMLQK